jgi:Tfp pilus assembly protein PilE
MQGKHRRGYALIDVLIVVVTLGILSLTVSGAESLTELWDSVLRDQ